MLFRVLWPEFRLICGQIFVKQTRIGEQRSQDGLYAEIRRGFCESRLGNSILDLSPSLDTFSASRVGSNLLPCWLVGVCVKTASSKCPGDLWGPASETFCWDIAFLLLKEICICLFGDGSRNEQRFLCILYMQYKIRSVIVRLCLFRNSWTFGIWGLRWKLSDEILFGSYRCTHKAQTVLVCFLKDRSSYETLLHNVKGCRSGLGRPTRYVLVHAPWGGPIKC